MSISSEVNRINGAIDSIRGDLVSLGVAEITDGVNEIAQKVKVLEKPTGVKGQFVGFVEDDVLGAMDSPSGNNGADVADCVIEADFTDVEDFVDTISVIGKNTGFSAVFQREGNKTVFQIPGREKYIIQLTQNGGAFYECELIAGNGEYIELNSFGNLMISSLSELNRMISENRMDLFPIGTSVFAENQDGTRTEFRIGHKSITVGNTYNNVLLVNQSPEQMTWVSVANTSYLNSTDNGRIYTAGTNVRNYRMGIYDAMTEDEKSLVAFVRIPTYTNNTAVATVEDPIFAPTPLSTGSVTVEGASWSYFLRDMNYSMYSLGMDSFRTLCMGCQSGKRVAAIASVNSSGVNGITNVLPIFGDASSETTYDCLAFALVMPSV